MPTYNPARRSTIAAIVITLIGAVLMAGKIYADSEPGAIPLLLVAVGVGWFCVSRVRARAHHRQPH